MKNKNDIQRNGSVDTNGRWFKSSSIRVRNSRIQGKGVFATKRIRPGQRIIEYGGELIDQDEEEKRYDDESMDRHHTFLFQIDDDLSIDASKIGNDAMYINHSCDPNCEAVQDDQQIFVEALKNIQPGTELTYDYQFEYEGRLTKAMREFYVCHCGMEKCRGTILKNKMKKKK